jgi:hypothetical protein
MNYKRDSAFCRVIKKRVAAGGLSKSLAARGFALPDGFIFRKGEGCGNGDRSHFIVIKKPSCDIYFMRINIAGNLFLSGLQFWQNG